MLILVVLESITHEMDFNSVISVSDLGGIVLSRTKFSHCFKQVHTTAFKRAGYFDETMPIVLGTQYDVNEVRD